MIVFLNVSTDLITVLDIASKFAIVGGFFATAVTFFITRKGLKHSEQIRMAHDISKELTEAERAVMSLPRDKYGEMQRRERNIQCLNVWEWFALLVNHKEIDDNRIIEYFRPSFFDDYHDILENYQDLKDDTEQFREMKCLYKK